jgi:MFS family permease
MAAARDQTSWYIGISAYWFATSFKWFVLLLGVLTSQVNQLVAVDQRNTAWGQVVMIGAAWAIIGPGLFGWLSDRTVFRYGRRRLYLSLGAALTLIALFTLSSAQSLPMLIVGYLLLQVSDDVGTGPYSAVIPESVPAELRGKASGILGQMRLIAQIASGVLGLVLSGNIVGIYLGIAIVNILGVLWTLSVMPDSPGERPNAGAPSFLVGFTKPWRDSDFRIVFLITFIGNLGYYIIQTYLPNFLRDRMSNFELFGHTLNLGIMRVDNPERAIYFLGLGISLIGITGALWCAKFSDRIGRKRTVFIGGMLMALPLVPFAIFHEFSVIAILAPVFGFGYGAYTASSWALVSDVLPDPSSQGRDMGIWQASWSSVQVVVGLFGGIIDFGNSRLGDGLGYTVAFIGGAVLMMLGVSLVGKVRGST